MIPLPTSCRSRLQERDFEFIAHTLTGTSLESSSLAKLLSDPDTLDSVLEQPQLFRAIIELIDPLSISPELYFFVLVRHNLKHAGIDDIEIADYVAVTLSDHARCNPLANRKGRRPEADFAYHIDFIEELSGLSATERFFLQVQCGNHFLVLTGLFPRMLRHRARRRGAPGVRYYEGVAREAFLAAGDHPLAEEFAVAEVYERLAGRFGETRRALNRMAEEYLFLGS
jgi:hypothetical protein